jgi:hypothetical protein
MHDGSVDVSHIVNSLPDPEPGGSGAEVCDEGESAAKACPNGASFPRQEGGLCVLKTLSELMT